MPRHVALLRGVSPMNARMPELKRCFEKAGFTDVKTLLSSGNVAFDATAGSTAALEKRIEAAMDKYLGRTFQTIVRTSAQLQRLVKDDPFTDFRLPANAKRVVTFLPAPKARVALPPPLDGARILAVQGCEVLSCYVPGPKGPVFMTLIEKTFGKNVTTRTWDTVRKCAAA